LASPLKYTKIDLYFQDESRFGLFTRNGSALTAKGVKPVCIFQQVFRSTYLFGAFSPISGKHILIELPECNACTFQIFLDQFSAQDPDVYKIIVLDNGAFHKASSLMIPDNIALLFLPPYSPELNPSEKIWALMKRLFTNMLITSMEQLSQFLYDASKSLTESIVLSTCKFSYIFSSVNWTI
jgi:transposase